MLWGRYASCREEARYPELWEGLRGLWVPAAGITGATLYDLSGWGQHGALTNFSVATGWDTNVRGYRSLTFDDSNDYVLLPPLPWLSGKSLSVSIWCVLNNLSSWNTIFSIPLSTTWSLPFARLCIRVFNNQVNVFVSESSSINASLSYAGLSSGVLHHIATSYDGSTLSVYLDGAMVASTPLTTTVTASTANALIGTNAISASGENAGMSLLSLAAWQRSFTGGGIRTLNSIGPVGLLEPTSRDWAYIAQGNPRRRRIICGSRV